MRHFSSLTSPTGLTAISIFLITLIGGFTLALKNKTTDQPAVRADSKTQQGSTDANPSLYKPAVSVKNLATGASETAEWLTSLGRAIASYIQAHDPQSSIYIEDLHKRQAVSIGETGEYSTKSLMKVPLVMNLYKAAELGRLDLDAMTSLRPEHLDQDFGDLWRQGAGHQLSLRQAAALALQESDNTAIKLINDHATDALGSSEKASAAIGMKVRVDTDKNAFVSAESYSSAFRCLHTSCYLNRQNSDEVLELLKQSVFKAPGRLLPADTSVAHKIGSVSDEARGGYNGFNDCGIIYGPKTPFIFCIMLRTPQPQADKDIGQIAKLAYDFLQK